MKNILFLLAFFPLLLAAQIRADQLTEITSPAATDAFYTAERGQFQKITLARLSTYFGAGGALQSLTMSGDTLKATTTGGTVLFVVLPYLRTEVDGSTSNELQTVTIDSTETAYTVTLSNGGGAVTFQKGGGGVSDVDGTTITSTGDTLRVGVIGAANIGTGAVGATQLASTAVTAGSYTNVSGTVDADGRWTAISSGTAPVTGSGTAGTIPVFTSGTEIGDGLLKQSGSNIFTGTLANSTHALQLNGALTLRNGSFTSAEAITGALDIRNQAITARSGQNDRLYGVYVQGNYTFNTANQQLGGLYIDLTSNATASQVSTPIFVGLDAAVLTESIITNRNASGHQGFVWSGGTGGDIRTAWVRTPGGGSSGSRFPGFGISRSGGGTPFGHVIEPTQTGWAMRMSAADANPNVVNASVFFSNLGVHIGNRASAPPFTYALDFETTAGIRLPRGTTAQRGVGAAGYFGFNTTWGGYEGHNGTAFRRLLDLADATPTDGHIPTYTGGAWTTNGNATATGTLDFPSTAANSSADLTITVTGAAVGETVSIGAHTAPPANGFYFAWVSATNTVTVRFINAGGGSSDPASASFTIRVHKI